jgi:hypothetical protein
VKAKQLSAAVESVDHAIAKVVVHLHKLAAAEEQAEQEAAQEAQDLLGDEPADEAVDSFDAGEPAVDEELEAMEEEPMAEDPANEPALEEESEEVSPEDAMTDEVLQDDAAPEEPAAPENPVAMRASLRRDIGDTAADLLDDYAVKIHKSVVTFFDNLTKKALDLGTDDPSDATNSLREQLLLEIGRRGLEKVEPRFLEWREGLIKQLMKEIKTMFEVPEEPKPELEVPEEPDTEPSFDEVPTEEDDSIGDVGSEPEPRPLPEPDASMPEAPESAEPPVTASVSAAVNKPFAITAQAMSFTIHKDLRPAGARSVKLS